MCNNHENLTNGIKIFTQVVWDEDGQSMERAYLYSVEDPGLWTAEKQWRPMENVMKQKGVGMYRTHHQYIETTKESGFRSQIKTQTLDQCCPNY